MRLTFVCGYALCPLEQREEEPRDIDAAAVQFACHILCACGVMQHHGDDWRFTLQEFKAGLGHALAKALGIAHEFCAAIIRLACNLDGFERARSN